MRKIAGLDVEEMGGGDIAPRIVLVLLHGHSMRAAALAPFGASLGIPAKYYFPEGPVIWPGGSRSWWALDEARRAAQLSRGPRDLFAEHPPGLDPARTALLGLLAEIRTAHPRLPLVLGGFSQGGMLSCDTVLRAQEGLPADGLALFSASRLAFDSWQPHLDRIRGLPVFVSHGEADDDLSFDAGVNLKDALRAAGADLSWAPFAGGHEIPLVVWRGLKKFLREHFKLDSPS